MGQKALIWLSIVAPQEQALRRRSAESAYAGQGECLTSTVRKRDKKQEAGAECEGIPLPC